jgi:predicted TIM-barrel fold metal-dependent hydrolase/L-rhamnose mutarotase
MRIVDTHLHLIYLDRFSYPWLEGTPLKRSWTLEEYLAEAEKLGIETSLHMEVDVAEKDMEAETDFALSISPRVSGAIAAARPERFDFPLHLERLAAKKGVKGIRRLLQSEPDELSASDLFASNLRRLTAHDLGFDLCIRADQLPLARALAAKCPDVQFILDHCGNPQIAKGDLGPWRQHIRELAELPNVAAKVSGIIPHAPKGWTVDDLRPAVEHIIESFGWDRVVWGSDHPVYTLNGTLTQWVEATREIVAGASAGEQSKLFYRNAERIYRLKPTKHVRYGSVMGLHPAGIDEYIRYHAAVWPKVLEQITRSNISNYSIYFREPENLLFAYFEYTGTDYEADMALMQEDEATREWWKVMTPLQNALPTRAEGEWWAGMREVFHLD